MEKQKITSQNTTNAVKQQSLSNLYIACQENDYMLALTLPETLEFNRINRLESNGNTALHVATALGRDEIISLLLNVYSVTRDQKDQNNRTAYEVKRLLNPFPY